MALMNRPRLLIEEWLPAAAIGVECMRERGSASALAPHTFLHVWWARRPLCASRTAVLGSLLPADFPRDVFEHLLGFGRPSNDLVDIRRMMDNGIRVDGGFGCDRAFKSVLREDYLEKAHKAIHGIWGKDVTVIDPMAGGGSIPLESARLGFYTLANEYNPVACSVLEATIDYPFRFGDKLAQTTRKWAKVWGERIDKRLASFYPEHKFSLVHAYVFARTVPCPDTGFETPLVPDWHLLKPKSGQRSVAMPLVDKENGTWSVIIREIGNGAGQLREPPKPTYSKGKGISLFTGRPIPAEYIKAMAQQAKMKSTLYALVLKTPQGLKFKPPDKADLDALQAAEKELAKLRRRWEKNNIIPTELYPEVTSDARPRLYGMPRWADLFSPRQLLTMGVLVEELQKLHQEVLDKEGKELAEPIIHLLAFVLDKFINYNSVLCSWHAPRSVMRSVFDRHDFSFKLTFAEMAPCNAGAGLAWAIDNVLEAYADIAKLSKSEHSEPATITLGTATNLPQIGDKSITAIVVDPPYADNVQYSELANFFYVWLKRMQGHRRPEWFSTYLCENSQEAVVNVARHRNDEEPAAEARRRSGEFYQRLMTETFKESRRVLRDDGVLTVMFTHKKQEAWVVLFTSLIRAGLTVTATWPVKTESQHSLHQARKNAAQSTVILVARKRLQGAGIGYFDSEMRQKIRQAAQDAAIRLEGEGLNRVDQLVGSFGPAMEVYSQYDEVRTDTGEPVGVDKAIDEASGAVSAWRIEQLAQKGLEGVEPEGRFALLCWDVLGTAEFRFNEAHLLGKAVGMDVDRLIVVGLVEKSGDKIKMLSAKQRRRERALEPEQVEELLFGPVTVRRRRTRRDALKVHPNDPGFRTALDGCHAMALRYIEAGGNSPGIGAAKSLANQQQWSKDSPVARLMEALVKAAPEAVKHQRGRKAAVEMFPEFRAWHTMLKPLFGIEPPDWAEKAPAQRDLFEETEEEEGELPEGEDQQ